MTNLPDSCYDYRYEAPPRRIVDTCIDCGNFIYEGDNYYNIRGMVICKDCMDEYKKEAEIDD